MASNMAQKRAVKANRRKAVVAEKRKLELLGDTFNAKVLRAAQMPIQHCLIPTTLFDHGIGTVMLARGSTPHYLTAGIFLVDTWCLGVKNTHFRTFDGETFEMIAQADDANPLASVDPSYARKLLRDAAAWAASIGFAPHRDFATIERLFGDVNADGSDATFQFGREGKPFYMPGPKESPAQVGRRLGQLRNSAGVERLEFASLDVG